MLSVRAYSVQIEKIAPKIKTRNSCSDPVSSDNKIKVDKIYENNSIYDASMRKNGAR
jgi:hypothetical protein